jgi:mercuric reductase
VLAGEKVLIATGSSSFIPPIEGLDHIRHLTNVETLELERVPETLLVVGAGPLGLEFSQMYRHFGSNVVVLEAAPTLLSRMEPEVGEAIGKVFAEEGITVYTNAKLQRVLVEENRKIAEVAMGDEVKRIEFSEILIATGRKPSTQDLDLKKAGVSIDAKGGIVVNENLQTSAPHIYAGGDVVGGVAFLETTAAKMGSIATENAWKDAKRTMDWSVMPQVIFTNPEIATVGLTEAESLKNLGVCACRTVPMSLVPKARILGDTRGFIKMAINPKTKEVIGVHIVAQNAGDLIHEGTVAVKHKLTIDDIIDTVHVFPTLSEATKLVAQAFYRDVSKLSCCTE